MEYKTDDMNEYRKKITDTQKELQEIYTSGKITEAEYEFLQVLAGLKWIDGG